MRAKINLPENIKSALDDGAHLVISISGGKDSDAMMSALHWEAHKHGWKNISIVHCDLGRMEWHQTEQYVRETASRYPYPLIILRREDRDLIDSIWRRWESIKASDRPDRCPWPDSRNRYCTSDLKRDVVNKWIRQQFPENAQVIVTIGLRAEESPGRAKKHVWEPRRSVMSTKKQRHVVDWHPILHWQEKDVWSEIGYTMGQLSYWREEVAAMIRVGMSKTWVESMLREKFWAHPAYALGNQRLSCSMCIMASQNDLLNGSEHNPDTYRELCRIEAESGWSFRAKMWLSDLRPELLPEETLAAVARHKERRGVTVTVCPEEPSEQPCLL